MRTQRATHHHTMQAVTRATGVCVPGALVVLATWAVVSAEDATCRGATCAFVLATSIYNVALFIILVVALTVESLDGALDGILNVAAFVALVAYGSGLACVTTDTRAVVLVVLYGVQFIVGCGCRPRVDPCHRRGDEVRDGDV